MYNDSFLWLFCHPMVILPSWGQFFQHVWLLFEKKTKKKKLYSLFISVFLFSSGSPKALWQPDCLWQIRPMQMLWSSVNSVGAAYCAVLQPRCNLARSLTILEDGTFQNSWKKQKGIRKVIFHVRKTVGIILSKPLFQNYRWTQKYQT